MKDLWEILTTNEDGVKYTKHDYVVGFAISLGIIALVLISSIFE